ncbi:hypothetical protein EJV47_08545 [Hymenobacter gummosus]|uniref:Lipoprotein n=1 Tax=Hymenobacter gummosus TaxID=1776032 RepID=A0A431U4J1_9BACT|nr:hypothetical protein [Hymenobacter gummosus]RTQ50671.1 hypothetical protein EJV47_08545 [Hymenobacter gummosus]
MKRTAPFWNTLGAGLILLLAGCGKDPDPCAKQHPTSAAFRMEEEISLQAIPGRTRRFRVDTIGATGMIPIFLTAEDSTADSYEWQIGSEANPRRGRQIELRFPQAVGAVNIRLTVRKKPTTGCFPNDSGVDVQQKALVVVDRDRVPVIGVYEGYNLSNPTNRFRVTIEENAILNLPQGCRYDLRNEFILGSMGLHAFSQVFSPEYGAGALRGWAELDWNSRNVLRFDYEYNDPTKPLSTSPRLHDTFVGTKVQ